MQITTVIFTSRVCTYIHSRFDHSAFLKNESSVTLGGSFFFAFFLGEGSAAAAGFFAGAGFAVGAGAEAEAGAGAKVGAGASSSAATASLLEPVLDVSSAVCGVDGARIVSCTVGGTVAFGAGDEGASAAVDGFGATGVGDDDGG